MTLEAVLHHAHLDMVCSLHTTKLAERFGLEIRTWDQCALRIKYNIEVGVVVVVGHAAGILPRHRFFD